MGACRASRVTWAVRLGVMLLVHVAIGVHDTTPQALSCSLYALVGGTYANVLVFVMGVMSAGGSVLARSHVSTLAFQFVHAHLGGAMLACLHRSAPMHTATLAVVLLLQAHCDLWSAVVAPSQKRMRVFTVDFVALCMLVVLVVALVRMYACSCLHVVSQQQGAYVISMDALLAVTSQLQVCVRAHAGMHCQV